jgi:3-phosphoshikimate 1-carboxyvinyltransferase
VTGSASDVGTVPGVDAAPPAPAAATVVPVEGPLDATVRVPGSKSLTNRALVCAALARGRSVLERALFADDTEAMVDGLRRLGIDVDADAEGERITIEGCAGAVPGAPAGSVAGRGTAAAADIGGSGTSGSGPGTLRVGLDARLSGTTARFLLPVAALAPVPVRVDGAPSLRARPMADGIAALRALGSEVVEAGRPGHLPVTVHGGPARSGAGAGGARTPARVTVAGDASSQFLSGLLLAAPAWPGGLELAVEGPLVSRPYVDMTVAVMRSFGAGVDTVAPGGAAGWAVAPTGYTATRYPVEPDASAASYAFAAAAICGGRVTVEGLGRDSLQGDLAFVDVLERMGCRVERGAATTTVERVGPLAGVEVDMGDLSDTAQTLAAVAVFAETPTRVTGIGFIRAKETDRVGNVVRELRRCGIQADEEPDGFLVRPGRPRSGVTVLTYDDHRMAMSFALLGLRTPGIRIADPGCVAKTFPAYWDVLDGLRR